MVTVNVAQSAEAAQLQAAGINPLAQREAEEMEPAAPEPEAQV